VTSPTAASAPTPAGTICSPRHYGLCTASTSAPCFALGVELADEAIRLPDLPMARERTIVVLGHESTGIPPEAVDLLDAAVEIPMIGTGQSLNVAVAGSLVLYRLAGLS
jgi:tRNA (guanosine-2'-O-)-methyltransferase